MSEEYAAAGANRSPSPRRDDRERARSRSRSPVRMDTERRDDRRDREDARARAQEEENRGNNLHVSGLSLRVEERDLEAAFSKYGRIAHCQVMRDPHTKESRGFAFVKFELAEEAEAAIAGLSGTQILDRTINVDKARRGRARTPTPGAYHGPPKREAFGGRMDRPYDPRGGYPPRGYERGYERGYDDRYGGSRGYDDRDRGDRYGGRGYDDRDRGGYAIPMRGDDRRGGGYDDRRYDDRERGYSSRSSGYDDRRRY